MGLLRRTSLAWLCLASASLAAEPLIDPSATLETIATEFELADGPAWDGVGRLFFPDVKAGKLYAYDPASKQVSLVLADAGRISATFYSRGRLFLSDNGNAVIASMNGGNAREPRSVLATFSDPKTMKPNDLVVDADGGIYVTLTGKNQVVFIRPTGEVATAVDGIESPNGIILAPDGKVLYVAAYKPKQIWAYDVHGGGIVDNGRVLATMDDGPALGADGMTVDSAGNVYCAGATDVWIWSPQGVLLHKLACPTRPINCAFGDTDLKSLYITAFGGLYRQRMRVSGPAPLSATAR